MTGRLQGFAYTFDHIAEVMDHFTEAMKLTRYTLYMQDYGGPVGFRMALAPGSRRGSDRSGCRRPQRRPRRELENPACFLGGSCRKRGRAARKPALARRRRARATSAAIRTSSDTTRTSGPMNTRSSNKPGQADIQSDLFYDYRTNVEAYPKWQAWMRKRSRACW